MPSRRRLAGFPCFFELPGQCVGVHDKTWLKRLVGLKPDWWRVDTEKHQQFAQRLVRSQDMVFRYIVSLVPRRADAEEVFQQTCLTLWENWENYDPALDFFPWACGFAHNHVRNFRRKMENRQVLLEDAVVEQLHQRSLDRQQQRNERQDALRECLEKLAAGQRAMIESYYGGYQSIQQIAHSQAATPNAVYKTLRRIRMALHECISQRMAPEATS